MPNLIRPILVTILVLSASTHAESADWKKTTPANIQTAFADDCDDLLIDGIKKARKEILVAAYSFTRNLIADALIARKKAGVSIRVKIDAHQATSKYTAPIVEKLTKAGIPVEQIKMPSYRAQHNKFMIVDSKIVMTGSFNFSSAAAEDNWENIVRIESPEIAARYAKEWSRISSRK